MCVAKMAAGPLLAVALALAAFPAASPQTLLQAYGLTVVLDESLPRPLRITYGATNFTATTASTRGVSNALATAPLPLPEARPGGDLCTPILNIGCSDQHGHGAVASV